MENPPLWYRRLSPPVYTSESGPDVLYRGSMGWHTRKWNRRGGVAEMRGGGEGTGGGGEKRRVAESEENGPPPVISLEPAAFPSRQITTSPPPSLFWYQIKPHTGRPCLSVSSPLEKIHLRRWWFTRWRVIVVACEYSLTRKTFLTSFIPFWHFEDRVAAHLLSDIIICYLLYTFVRWLVSYGEIDHPLRFVFNFALVIPRISLSLLQKLRNIGFIINVSKRDA